MWVAIRPFRKSLRDVINNSKPQDKYSKKYSQQPEPKSPTITDKNEQETILLIAKVYLRSTQYTDLQLHPNMNSRQGKYYFTIKDPINKQTYTLALITIGKDSNNLLSIFI